MKGMLILGGIGLALGCGIYLYLQVEVAKDHGHLVAYACGNPQGGTVEIQVAVPYRMTRLDPLRLDEDSNRMITWNEWLAEHFELYGTSGERVELVQSHFANLIPEAKVGTPDFYAVGRLAANSDYTFEYLPIGVNDSKRYRHTFTVSDQGKSFERARFHYVDESVE